MAAIQSLSPSLSRSRSLSFGAEALIGRRIYESASSFRPSCAPDTAMRGQTRQTYGKTRPIRFRRGLRTVDYVIVGQWSCHDLSRVDQRFGTARTSNHLP